MSFTSLAFLIFMLLFMAAWPIARTGPQTRWGVIVAFSLVFYGWWDWRFLFLLLGTGLLDFWLAWLMERFPSRRNLLLGASLISNLGCLGFFKYLGFAAESLRAMLGIPPTDWSWTHEILLPVGISFYIFQSLSYTIDVYRGEIRAIRDPLHFLAFLSMFPQLVAGPIVRARDLLPQLETPGHFNRSNRLDGACLATWGFVKKLVIADGLAPTVNDLFGRGEIDHNAPLWWLAASLFAIQIFADFSGYSDIARGIARWMGYEFPVNFAQPYAASGLRDFWGRWHISLSTWFRDYLYIPLGGSRKGPSRTLVNLLLTMLVSGLWHGANWTFVAWGAWHGLGLVGERRLGLDRIPASHRLLAVSWRAFVVVFVLVGWVLFRAESIGQARTIINAMFVGDWDPAAAMDALSPQALVAVTMASLGSICWWISSLRPADPSPSVVRRGILCLAGVVAAVFLRGPGGDFIYFQF